MGNVPLSPKHPDYKDIRLTRAEIKLLRIIKKRGSITEDEAAELSRKFKQENAYLRLDNMFLIRKSKESSPKYESFYRSEIWLRFHREDMFYKILPLTISIAALFVSVASLLTKMLK